tara:strand:- start:309 stop:527 length:219 start_codon:yes stop_codon:yes gene_type:complete
VGSLAINDDGSDFTEAGLGAGPMTYEGNTIHSTLVTFDGTALANGRSFLAEVSVKSLDDFFDKEEFWRKSWS